MIHTDSFLETSANEFFVGFTHNYHPYYGIAYRLQLIVTTSENDLVNFTVTAANYTFTGVTIRNSSTIVTIPRSFQVMSSVERNKGIHLKAEGNSKVSVFGISINYYSTDAFLAFPCTDLQLSEYEYYGVTYNGSSQDVGTDAPADLLIVACEDNTIVTTPSSTVVLNRMETYLIESKGNNITGTKVTTSKPVAFYSSHECALVPNNDTVYDRYNYYYCSHLNEQLTPTVTWGRYFLVASLFGGRIGEIFRLVSAHDSTEVSVHCTNFSETTVFDLENAGNWEEFQIDANGFCSIRSSAPILVVQFAISYAFDRSYPPFHAPFMMVIPPIEQYTNNYVTNDFLDTIYVDRNYLTLYVTQEYYEPEKIFVDNIPQSVQNWTQVYCYDSEICGYVAIVEVTRLGLHHIYHEDPLARFGVSAYGLDYRRSYGYPAAGGINLIQRKKLRSSLKVRLCFNYGYHACLLHHFSSV